MVTARDVMTPPAGCLPDSASVADAAGVMRDLDLPSVPVCDTVGQLLGVVTDRDVVGCLAAGWDPYATALRELLDPDALAVSADEPVESALVTMAIHHLRRLPVVDGGNLVGMVADRDIARSLPDDTLGRLLMPRTA
jgi:CBS domain-containing protein